MEYNLNPIREIAWRKAYQNPNVDCHLTNPNADWLKKKSYHGTCMGESY